MKADRSISIIGHIFAPILGLGLGYLALCYLQPEIDTWQIFHHPGKVAKNEPELPSPDRIVPEIPPSSPKEEETPAPLREEMKPDKPSRTPRPDAQLIDQLTRQLMRSVVNIELAVGNGANVFGSGVVVEDGIIATNYHVIHIASEATSANVEFEDGSIAEIKGVLAEDRGKDIVLLSVKTTAPPVTLSPALPRIGVRVIAFGSPNGLAFSTSTGEVSAIRAGSKLDVRYRDGSDFGRSPDAGSTQRPHPVPHTR